ncbi:unnamed protein product, partial [Callosobruchus maculatus]
MERYMLQQRNEIIKIHYKNAENLSVKVRKTRTLFGRRAAPCRSAIQKLVQKFELLIQVSDVKNKNRARRSRTMENIAAVAQSVEQYPGLCIPRRSLELGIPQTLLHRILHKDLGIKAYKVQLTQESSRPIINNVVSLLIGSLKCMKMIRNFIEKSSGLTRPISISLATSTSKIVASGARKTQESL